MAAFATRDGELLVGDTSISRLAQRAGSTPFFAYDRTLLTEHITRLRAALPAAIDLSYAVKANPMPALVQHLAAHVDGFDVASALEMKTALDTPISPDHVSFAGPGKTDAELTQAVAAGVLVEIESPNEVTRLVRLGDLLGLVPRVALRINPDFAVKGSGMRMGGGSQQFGVDAEVAPEVLAQIGEAGLAFEGFHVFAGSQNLNAELLCQAQRNIADLFVRLADHAPSTVRYLNLGGGFGIPYFDKDSPLDVVRVGENLDSLLAHTLGAHFPRARMVMELGRYIVGECGVYVTRIIDRKISRGRTYLVVDGGLHHQLAASGNFGQVLRRNFPVAVGNHMGRRDLETVSVVGCLCTPLDLLADNAELPRSEVGDLIVLFNAGAYGLTASPTAFLGHPAPAEMLV